MQFDTIRAIITGGASGLGQSVAECIVAAGGQVALLDVNAEAGQALATTLGGRAPRGRARVFLRRTSS